MNKLIGSIAILGLVVMLVGVVATADTTAVVSATVTTDLITISVDDGSVAYGILPLNTNQDTTASGLNDTQVVTNDGNVNVDLEVKSSDAIGGTGWNLAATNASSDEFTHEYSSDGGTGWATFNVDNTTYASLATSIAALGTQNLDLRIKTPTSVTDNTEKTITVTVLATKSP